MEKRSVETKPGEPRNPLRKPEVRTYDREELVVEKAFTATLNSLDIID